VAPDGTVSGASDAAGHWLDAIDDRARVPSAVRAVVAAATAHGTSRSALPARDGRWVVLHGATVSGVGADVSVIVEGARPAVLSEVITGAYGLTPREREVTALAAQGRSTKHIAAALGISPFTAQDHLKAIYAKAGVQSRGELVAAIFANHYEPRWEAGSTPGPYGWYLDEEASA
jgi:DNA-binding CsgD family transcriptional regulator